ncbi:bifunctional ADP-dependent NAD(P)H-hydrate dehydratase/NAD(P)H-hydrate epimerase [Sphingobium chungbukense]|uniref:Bifunctional NAD(P)H-hydrate repair enzyme n=1 Tax=Sphingobium chungbukense TaxID=56193 RepID=A0A0M3AW09_9SPHN|nr:bifunctional ADP-dependent NAD(P)H-hydrate dehydratase/NAD(P)H-hydrate epimerase [Sphingobium chungbukense]KKW92739.1 carbohydrate kinase [Sphingobium chungbukense]
MSKAEAILTAAQMRAAEQAVFATGVPEYELMERAGAAAAEIVWRAGGKRDLLVLCGPGNNGGDGFVIARLLRARGVPVRVAALGESLTPSSLKARACWAGPVEDIFSAAPATQIVDALFGTGLSRGLDPVLADRLCALTASAGFSYAVDLPSGVDTDSGALLSAVPAFGICVALGAFKSAHLLQPSANCWQRLICADIGIDVSAATVHRLSPPPMFPPKPLDHKYSRGLVAVVGGEMAGAGQLASHAAAHSGAGMVRHIARDLVGGGPDAIITQKADGAGDVGRLLNDARFKAVLVGPGLGLDQDATARLEAAMVSGHPLVLDADALTLLAGKGVDAIPAGAILTPHEGEFVRLFGDLPGSKIDRALEAARRADAILIYKGSDSVIAAPDGRAMIASGSSAWLSTAGTGDVLAGLVAGRLAVTGDRYRAACEALWLHGEAARRAGAAFVADDLLVELPAAIASRL